MVGDPNCLALICCRVGQILAKYRSGKLPKAFKVIPSLTNWEDVSCKLHLHTTCNVSKNKLSSLKELGEFNFFETASPRSRSVNFTSCCGMCI